MINELMEFVKNGGRIRAGGEPKHGEPFYGEYMKQSLMKKYKPGDKVRVHIKYADYVEEYTCEGVIIAFDYGIELLTYGKTVYKNERNKRSVPYEIIQSVEMLSDGDGTFDLAAVDKNKWNWLNSYNLNEEVLFKKKEIYTTETTDVFLKRVIDEIKEDRKCCKRRFQTVHPDVRFEKTHIIEVRGGCSLYWPFENDGISAEVYMVRDDNRITPIECKTAEIYDGSYHAYNVERENAFPSLYIYLPDNGFVYEDVNIVCVWTVSTTVFGAPKKIKMVNVHRVGKIRPIKNDCNIIYIDMEHYPLLAHGESLFTESKKASMLEHMMDKDMYILLNTKDENYVVIKRPEDIAEKDVEKYVVMTDMAINKYDPIKIVNKIVGKIENDDVFLFAEVFCNIDKEAEQYYSIPWQKCRSGYPFTLLENE